MAGPFTLKQERDEGRKEIERYVGRTDNVRRK